MVAVLGESQLTENVGLQQCAVFTVRSSVHHIHSYSLYSFYMLHANKKLNSQNTFAKSCRGVNHKIQIYTHKDVHCNINF